MKVVEQKFASGGEMAIRKQLTGGSNVIDSLARLFTFPRYFNANLMSFVLQERESDYRPCPDNGSRIYYTRRNMIYQIIWKEIEN